MAIQDYALYSTSLSGCAKVSHTALCHAASVMCMYMGQQDNGVNSQVVAEDGDEGENGRVIYSIEDPFQRMNFTVNNVTGVISTARAFDYEDLTSYVFTVRARGEFSVYNYSMCIWSDYHL